MEHRLFDPANPPEWLDPEWWIDTPNCDHLAHPAGVHRARIYTVAGIALELFSLGLVRDAVDMGAGDGAVLWRLMSQTSGDIAGRAWGYEIIKDSVRIAREERGVDVRRADVVANRVFGADRGLGVPGLNWADLVICTEMLEHLADPHAWARTMAVNVHVNAAQNRNGWLIASSPWRETEYRHEANHAWTWDMRGYKEMLTAAGWFVIQTLEVEWSQVVLACRRPDGAAQLQAARDAALEDRYPLLADPDPEVRADAAEMVEALRPHLETP